VSSRGGVIGVRCTCDAKTSSLHHLVRKRKAADRAKPAMRLLLLLAPLGLLQVVISIRASPCVSLTAQQCDPRRRARPNNFFARNETNGEQDLEVGWITPTNHHEPLTPPNLEAYKLLSYYRVLYLLLKHVVATRTLPAASAASSRTVSFVRVVFRQHGRWRSGITQHCLQ